MQKSRMELSNDRSKSGAFRDRAKPVLSGTAYQQRNIYFTDIH
jgi:hypothetical protein